MPRRIRELPVEYEAYERRLARQIGARLRERRRQLALSQEQIRARCEVAQVAISRTQYSRIEHGDSVPNAVELIAIHHALDVSLDWLLLGDAAAVSTTSRMLLRSARRGGADG
jgi:transcriptional regulator with XRE-family HTH domain